MAQALQSRAHLAKRIDSGLFVHAAATFNAMTAISFPSFRCAHSLCRSPVAAGMDRNRFCGPQIAYVEPRTCLNSPHEPGSAIAGALRRRLMPCPGADQSSRGLPAGLSPPRLRRRLIRDCSALRRFSSHCSRVTSLVLFLMPGSGTFPARYTQKSRYASIS